MIVHLSCLVIVLLSIAAFSDARIHKDMDKFKRTALQRLHHLPDLDHFKDMTKKEIIERIAEKMKANQRMHHGSKYGDEPIELQRAKGKNSLLDWLKKMLKG